MTSRSALLLVFGAGCSVVKQEPGIEVAVSVAGTDAPSTLAGARVYVQSVELVPCQVAWKPIDLVLSPARADHSITSETGAAFDGSTDLLGSPNRVVVTPPPDTYCFARFVLEPGTGDDPWMEASLSAETPDGTLTSSRVAWLDAPVDFTLDETNPQVALSLAFSLASWPEVAANGADALFDHARDTYTLSVD